MQKYLEAGKVVTTHGVRGEMKLELWCDGVAFLKKVGRLYTTPQGGRCYKITSIRPQGQMALLQLEGVSDMDAARALRGRCSTLTVTMPLCLRASGMWPTSLGVKCGMPIPARCTAW
ncbi:ribosome maturation factor RimM [Faecalibacterium prausnitzii]|uniref:ribosome maturation factor RimM n=1 Tax=Faecalibacterium prausnitzii TaxID=853 RepID=UPI001CBB9359|nr:hypothetical protein [Faecalibacterium prausnitzii]